MTLDEIVEATKHWPPEQVGELVDRLTEELHASAPEIEAAWKTEIDRRIEEIESGKVKGVPPKIRWRAPAKSFAASTFTTVALIQPAPVSKRTLAAALTT